MANADACYVLLAEQSRVASVAALQALPALQPANRAPRKATGQGVQSQVCICASVAPMLLLFMRYATHGGLTKG